MSCLHVFWGRTVMGTVSQAWSGTEAELGTCSARHFLDLEGENCSEMARKGWWTMGTS